MVHFPPYNGHLMWLYGQEGLEETFDTTDIGSVGGMEGEVGPVPHQPGVADTIIGLMMPLVGWGIGRMVFPIMAAWVGPRLSAIFVWLNLLGFLAAGVGIVMGNVLGTVLGTLFSLIAGAVVAVYALGTEPREYGAFLLGIYMFFIPLGALVYQVSGEWVLVFVIWTFDFILTTVTLIKGGRMA